MGVLAWLGTMLVIVAFGAAGCGGDNLELCEGCGTPTPTATLSPTPTTSPSSTPTPGRPVPATSPG